MNEMNEMNIRLKLISFFLNIKNFVVQHDDEYYLKSMIFRGIKCNFMLNINFSEFK